MPDIPLVIVLSYEINDRAGLQKRKTGVVVSASAAGPRRLPG